MERKVVISHSYSQAFSEKCYIFREVFLRLGLENQQLHKYKKGKAVRSVTQDCL